MHFGQVRGMPLCAALVSIWSLAGGCRQETTAPFKKPIVAAQAGTDSQLVAVVSEALTAAPSCYGSPGLQSQAPWPMAGLCPMHRGSSPAVAAQTNALAWTTDPVTLGTTAFRGTPVVSSDGTIYVGSATGLYRRKADGSAQWTSAATPAAAGSPAIGADGTLYYVTSGTASVVRALSVGTTAPTQKWVTSSTVFGGTASSGPALSADGATVYASSQNGKLVALRTAAEGSNAAGSARWTFQTSSTSPSPFWTSPAIGPDGNLYIGADNGLYAVSSTGTLVPASSWNGTSVPTSGSPAAIVRSSPATASDGTVYFGTDNKGLVAVQNGAMRWRYPSSGTPPIIRSSPAIGPGGEIYFGAQDKKVYAIKPDGSLKWSFTTTGNVDATPAVGADGVVYIGGDAKTVYALKDNGTTTPTTLWSKSIGTGTTSLVRSALSIARNGSVYVATDDAKLWAFGPGSCQSSDTTCNGIDDNCNGSIDEGYVAVGTSCGVGACARSGTSSCVGGAVQSNCTAGTPAASDTTCNGVDDNCNGTKDEGYVPVATSCGVGACARSGTSSCVGGAVQSNCISGTPAASDTTCNGVDDNCNGTKDEGYVAVATTCGVGACARGGTSSCLNGTVQSNCTAGTPAASDTTCNGVDDNCNGTKDEGYVAVATTCGVGACARGGTSSCVNGTVQSNCTAGAPGASDTTCNGVDENCNGTNDEGYVPVATSCGVGACLRSASSSCVSGHLQGGTCAPANPLSSTDVTCDSVDDNCNGVADEGCNAVTSPGPNLLVNGNFDVDTAPAAGVKFDAAPPNTQRDAPEMFSRVTTDTANGTAGALRVSLAKQSAYEYYVGASGVLLGFSTGVDADTTLAISFWAKSLSGGTLLAFNRPWGGGGVATRITTSWQQYQIFLRVQLATSGLFVALAPSPDAVEGYQPIDDGVFLIDEVSVRHVPDAPRLCGTAFDQPCSPVCSGGTCPAAGLDLVSTPPTAAFSVHARLLSAYTGAGMRLRRVSDNGETNVGYTASHQIDMAAINTFCGASDCYVSVLYDQSGQNRDVRQPTYSFQRKIYDGTLHSLVSGADDSNQPQSEMRRYNDLGLDSDAMTFAIGAHFTDLSSSQGLAALINAGSDYWNTPALGPQSAGFSFGDGYVLWPGVPGVSSTRLIFRHTAGAPRTGVTLLQNGVDRGTSTNTSGNLTDPLGFSNTSRIQMRTGYPVELRTAAVWNTSLSSADVAHVDAALDESGAGGLCAPIQWCTNDDGCCPSECSHATDNDCPAPKGFAPDAFQCSAGSSGVCPRFLCVQGANEGRVAVFQVLNTTGQSVTIPIGSSNSVSPGPGDLGQPTTFPSGTEVMFKTPISQPITWQLGQGTATARATGPACADTGFTPLQTAPVVLVATHNNDDGTSQTASGNYGSGVPFTIPERLRVTFGNAGNGTANLSFSDITGASVTCVYRGGSSAASPTSELDVALGRYYHFVSCSNGASAGQTVIGTQWRTEVVSGDPQIGQTEVELQVGPGCSGLLDPPFWPEDVVQMREGFDWTQTTALPETDSAGLPAMRYALLYVELPEQIEALKHAHVYFRRRPIFQPDLARYQGQCGTFGSSYDGHGEFVFAIIPATVYNYIRNHAVASINQGQGAVYFRAVVLPPIPEASLANPDGTLSWAAMEASGFKYYDDVSELQSPLFGIHIPIIDDIIDIARGKDPLKAIGGILFPGLPLGVNDGTGVSPTSIFVPFDFSEFESDTHALIDAATSIVGVIDEFVGGSVMAHMNLEIMNNDPAFPTFQPMTRAWGPIPGGVTRKIVPHGAVAEIIQTAAGFIPVSHAGKIGADGHFDIKLAKGTPAARKAGALCIQHENDAARISSGGPEIDEFCDFRTLVVWDDFQHDIPDPTNPLSPPAQTVQIGTPAMNAFAQLTDGWDYMTETVGHSPRQAFVSMGVGAEVFARVQGFEGQPRPFTGCFNFPEIKNTVSTLFQLVDAVTGGIAHGVQVAGDFGLLSLIDLQQDIFLMRGAPSWPTSRGVTTHEYGHFVMCDAFHNANSSIALVQLYLDRIKNLNPSDRSPSAGTAITMESFADLFASQVAGGTNYAMTNTANVTSGYMQYCIDTAVGGPLACVDSNYRGVNDAVPDDYTDEITRRMTTYYDAFDRADDSSRSASGVPANADRWQSSIIGLIPAPTAHLLSHDENVALDAHGLLDWLTNAVSTTCQGPSCSSTPFAPTNFAHALAVTMEQSGVSWCDACSLFASHDPDPQLAPPITPGPDLWRRCGDPSSELAKILWAAPTNLRMDTSCHPCSFNQIVAPASGACTDCPENTVPSPTTETCVPCPADYVLDVSAQQFPGCAGGPIMDLISHAPDDVCPDTFVAEVRGLDSIWSTSTQSSGLSAFLIGSANLSGTACTSTSVDYLGQHEFDWSDGSVNLSPFTDTVAGALCDGTNCTAPCTCALPCVYPKQVITDFPSGSFDGIETYRISLATNDLSSVNAHLYITTNDRCPNNN